MDAKFFGDSYFGGDFLIKNAPLSEEKPLDNRLKLSFQEIGNNLVITALNKDGKVLTVFGVADTTSVSFEVTPNISGDYSTENENLTWEWEENSLIINVSTYGFLKTVIFDNNGFEVFYPVFVSENKIAITFPETQNNHQIKLLYSYNNLDVSASIGDAALRNVGKTSGRVPLIESNNRLPSDILSYVKEYTINNSGTNIRIDFRNGNLQIVELKKAVNFEIAEFTSNMENGDRLILQIKNSGYNFTVNNLTLCNSFFGICNLEFVKINNKIQYWGITSVQEI